MNTRRCPYSGEELYILRVLRQPEGNRTFRSPTWNEAKVSLRNKGLIACANGRWYLTKKGRDEQIKWP